MRTSPLCATIVAGFLALCVLASGQPAAAQSASGKNTVVIDVSRVFKEHLRFKQQMDLLKKDLEAFQAYGRTEETKLRDRVEKLKTTFTKGSAEYKREEEAIQRQGSELQLQGAQKQKDLMEREAKVYFNVYNEVAAEVAKFADDNHISLVLRYNSDPVNPDDRNAILMAVNNPIVFQRNLDITSIVIRNINKGVDEAKRTGPQVPRKN